MAFSGGGEGMAARPKGYVATAALEIDGVDLDKVGSLTKAIASDGGAEAAPVRYGFKDAAAVRRSILREAFLDARGKAQEAASAAGLRLGDVYLLETGTGPQFMGRSEGSISGGTMTNPVLTRQVTVSATVTVRFRLVK